MNTSTNLPYCGIGLLLFYRFAVGAVNLSMTLTRAVRAVRVTDKLLPSVQPRLNTVGAV